MVLAVEAIALFFFENRLNLVEASWRLLVAYLAIVLALAGMITFALVILCWGSGRIWRKSLSQVTLLTLARAVEFYSKPAQADGIAEYNGHLVIKLPWGEDSGMVLGQRVLAANVATKEPLGILEPLEVWKSDCLCFVSDAVNVDFWEKLDERKGTDFSPPPGVVFSREIPEGFLEFTGRIVPYWRG